ncbi:hypothetical protein BDZ91DRAFT_807062 [Kalaharituber pfeilii]|nr:hypothetical protein BDZ91DRAFT_807062 [Kalaharituber pfeilii]
MEIAVHSEKETSEVNSSMLNSMAAHEYHSSAVASRTVWQHSRSTAARIHPRMAAFTQHDSKANLSHVAEDIPHGSIRAAWQHSHSMAEFTQHGSEANLPRVAAFTQRGTKNIRAAWQHSTQYSSIRAARQHSRAMAAYA